MGDLPNWDDLRLVRAIGDAGSLVGAADALSLNHSTVFRRLGALERAIGQKLFERSRLAYAPTAVGLDLLALARKIGGDVDEFSRRVVGRDEAPAGELRVTTNDAMLVQLLPPILARFSAAYPGIRLDMIVGNELLNLARRDADVAVRATRDPPDTLVGRRIGAIAWAPYGPRGTPSGALEDPATRWVGPGEGLAELSRWLSARGAPGGAVYRVDTVLGMTEAVAAGLGCGYLPCFLGDDAPRLMRIGPRLEGASGDLWLLTHADLRGSARVRAFMDMVGGELSRRRALFAGGEPAEPI